MEHLLKIFFCAQVGKNAANAPDLSDIFAFQPSQCRFLPFFPRVLFHVEQ